MSLFRRISNLFSRSRLDQDIDAELQSHIEMRIEDNVKRGMSPQEARSAALRAFGNVTRVREETWRVRSFAWIEQFLGDVFFGFRTLRKNAAFTIAAVLTLALGIGAYTALVSVVHGAL